MYKLVMNSTCRKNVYRGLNAFLCAFILTFVTIDNGDGKVINKCPKIREKICKAGEEVLSTMVNNMDEAETNFYLWDAKPSKLVRDFWHLSFTDSVIMDQKFTMFTDGKHVIPVIMPVVPGRDFSTTDDTRSEKKTEIYKKAEKKEALRRDTTPAEERPASVNRIPIEQIGMLVGPIDVKAMIQSGQAFSLVKGGKKHGMILLVDDLMSDTVAEFLDDFRNKKEKWHRYKNSSVIFVPFFGFMGDSRSAFLGKYFYAMIEAGVPPQKAVYNLSRLATASKVNKNMLREYCNIMVNKEKKPIFNRAALEMPSQTVFAKAIGALKLGIMQPSYYILNGQFQMWD